MRPSVLSPQPPAVDFEACHSVGQIRNEPLARDVVLSDSQITKLGRKFILLLAHRRAIPRINQAMVRSGSYILHLDAVHQEDVPALMSDNDGLSGLVLSNVKVPSEHAALVKNFSNPDYMKTLLDGRPNIEAVFADLNWAAASEDLTTATEAECVLPGFKALTKMPDLPVRISERASAALSRVKSNQIVWLWKITLQLFCQRRKNMQADPRNRFLNFAGAVLLAVPLVAIGLAAGPSMADAAGITVQEGGSIQAAIDAATSGDTVTVESGTYAGGLTIAEKSLILLGVDTGAGKPVIDGEGGSEPVVSLQNSSGCTVEGFAIQNSGSFGLKILGSPNAIVRSNELTNTNGIDVEEGSDAVTIAQNTCESNGNALYVYNSPGPTITGNTFQNVSSIGLYIRNSGDAAIRDNTFENVGNRGIYARDSINPVITGNTLNTDRDAINVRGSDNAVITKNTSKNAINVQQSNNAVISENSSADSSGYGIYVSNLSDLVLSQNTVSSAGSDGIYLNQITTGLVEHNAVTGVGGTACLVVESCSDAIVRYNTLNESVYYLGLAIWGGSQGCSFYGNTVANNNGDQGWSGGLYLEDADAGNTFYLNDFENDVNVVETAGGSDYHSPVLLRYQYGGETRDGYLGNRWSDYTGTDANGDGVGDTPYVISGDIQDPYPLVGTLDAYTDIIEIAPDIAISNLTPPYVVGVSLNNVITVTLRNNGLGAAGTFNVYLYADGELVDTVTVEGLAAGEEIQVAFTWTPLERMTGVVLTAETDPDYAGQGINLDDNQTVAEAAVDVLASDLTVTAVAVAAEVDKDEARTVTVTVANTGSAPAMDFTVGLYCDMSPVVPWAMAHPAEAALQPGLFNTVGAAGLVARAVVDNLGAGESTDVEISWTPADPGVHFVSAWVDMTAGTVEMDDANNMLATPVQTLVTPYAGTVTTLNQGDSLQTAVDAAATGDTILLNPGTYLLEPDGQGLRLNIPKGGLTFKSAGGAVIDGSVNVLQDPAIAWTSDAPDTVFDGIAFVNFAMAAGTADKSGLMLKNCTFQGGLRAFFGAEDALANTDGLTVSGCLFEAADVNAFDATAADVTIENTVFDGSAFAVRNPSAFSGFIFRNNMVAGATVPEGANSAFVRIEGPDGLVAGNVFEAMSPGAGKLALTLVGSNATVQGNRFGALSGDGHILLENGSNNRIYLNDFPGEAPLLYGNPVLQSPEAYTYTYQEQSYTSVLGNRYASYGGADADGNGVGDTSMDFTGASDTFPLMDSFAAYTDLAAEKANLTVGAVTGPATAHVGISAEVTAEVSNTGGPAHDFTVALYADGTLVETLTVDTLGFGETETLTFTWTPAAEAQAVVLSVIADDGNTVAESNEDDNTVAADTGVGVTLAVDMSIDPATVETENGSAFDVAIRLAPNAYRVAGVQFDLTFNPAILEVTGVTESTLLNQDGAGTYFNGGAVDNTAGTLTGVVGAITTPGADVGTAGVFAVVSFLAKGDGVSVLTLSNAIVGDMDAQPLTVALTGGFVQTAFTYTATGQAAYGGGQTGPLYVGVYLDEDLNQPLVLPVAADLGTDVTVSDLGPGTGYYFGGFIDSNENNLRDPAEAFGAVMFDIVDDDVTGLDAILSDPDADTDNLPDYWQTLYAGYNCGQGIGGGDDDADHDGYSNAWEWANGTDPTVVDDPDGQGYDPQTDQRVVPAGWSVTRSHGDYRPGQSFTVTVTVAYSGDVTALGITEALPEGWTYVSAESAGGMNVFATGDGRLEFAWLSLPTDGQGQSVNPFTFSYTLQVPETAGGDAVFDGQVIMRIGGEAETAFDMARTVARRFAFHTADFYPADWSINLSELLRVIQLYNVGAYHCDGLGEDGFNPGAGEYMDPAPHSADYNPTDGVISVSELLRVVQIYNVGGYCQDALGEDGYRPSVQ